jgi:hypothetical protein
MIFEVQRTVIFVDKKTKNTFEVQRTVIFVDKKTENTFEVQRTVIFVGTPQYFLLFQTLSLATILIRITQLRPNSIEGFHEVE